MKDYLTIGETANLLSVSIATLRNWDRDGQFIPHHRTKGGQRVYSKEQISEYLQEDTSGGIDYEPSG